MARILVLHGPNLNLLGTREPEIYGTDTLEEINTRIAQHASTLAHEVSFLQSNAEHELIEAVHQAKRDDVRFIIINPGAFTHTSIALRDAFLSVAIPFIEVHLSNVHAREAFRQTSYLSDIAVAVITGLGADGYEYAASAAAARIDD
ncbi:MAG: type II 3-dehydroquinate dehydratase [Pseudomonadales bacterium]|jgi:3-dehydroquinate dehydratase-2|nr:type II 3-dehydroquinate dehydratase [Pseudomonadales bacterium]MDP6470752.1 type II 3-dehydroquinate dehydratase [Pseudomonadales bacterium]MDP6828296.1 type II 3-dehydroquinate dehydratase [Pseudomonadales bacterium]MDP6970433.1 type II 3-dehydroquinate dehydratase [Pseudomonadales bacterium]|tara:strand:+ start:755 stop:1195 length:441 start_codon:yes stop_codon:yes gene_type:complete